MRVLVLGATGFLGQWVVEKLRQLEKIEGREIFIFKSSLSLGVDLRENHQALKLFQETKPDYVINCAAYVGGIQYGYLHPAEIYYNNMQMSLNILDVCKKCNVKRLVQPISNCAYPAQESFFQEDNFWSGSLHDSVLVYGMTRKTMVVGSWAYQKQYSFDTISLVLSNMYGPYDHFDEIRSHALGAMIKKITEAKKISAKQVAIWGSGKPIREWLYVEDGAEALVRALDMKPYNDIINIGVGKGISIGELAHLIKDIIGWEGEFVFDTAKPDGAPYKTVDGTRGERLLSWRPQASLKEGIRKTVAWYVNNKDLTK